MNELLQAMLQCTLTMTGITILALGISPLLQRKYASRGIYALWVVVLLGFLIPLRLPASKSAVRVYVPRVVTQPLQAAMQTPPPMQGGGQTTGSVAVHSGRKLSQITVAQVLLGLYGMGALMVLVMKTQRHIRFMRAVRRWAREEDAPERLRGYERAKNALQMKRAPKLMRCAAVDSPMLVGVFHPRILLPDDAPDGEALEMVLRHELIHYRRGDLLIKVAALLSSTIHWFNPTVHMAVRMADYYCELSCDAQAVEAATMEARALYSHAILAALRPRRSKASALTTSFRAGKRTLKGRLMGIMNAKQLRKRGGILALAALVLTLGIGTSFVLAQTQEGLLTEPMTVEELIQVNEDSFAKMRTTSESIYDVVDNLGIPENLEAYEREYTERTGYARKDDLVYSGVPGVGDLSYEAALAYARALIIEKYGTPVEELDAMGVYVRFIVYAYMDNESEWEFFFSPMRDADIDEGHTYDAPGEYRVSFTSPSKEVTLCNWYIDDFWTYAQWAWDEGDYDIVYKEAQHGTFLNQSLEQQAHFRALLAQQGYDVPQEYDILRTIELDVKFAQNPTSLIGTQNAAYIKAAQALKEEFGLDAQALARYGYIAVVSPLTTGTTDICFSYNYESETQAWWEIASYVKRLGMFLVRIDPETNEVLDITHKANDERSSGVAEGKLLARGQWDANDFAEFDALCIKIMDVQEEEHGNANNLEAAVHALLREAGGDSDSFPARPPQSGEITQQEAEDIAKRAVMEKEALTQEEYEKRYNPPQSMFDGRTGRYDVYCMTIEIAQSNEETKDYYVEIDAQSKEVLTIEIALGNG